MTRRLEQSPATTGSPSCLPSKSEALAAGIRDSLLFMKLRVWNLTAKLYGFFSEMGRAVEIGKKKKKKKQSNASTWRVWTTHKCLCEP